jgi:zinc protease
MKKIASTLMMSLLITGAVSAASSGGAPQTPLAPHPGKLAYAPLQWSVPLGAPYRVTLKNGLRAYVAADSQLPLVQISAYIRHGSLFDPRGKEGLSSLMAQLMRTGGTKVYQADSLNALLDLYAMHFSVSASDDHLGFSAEFLSDYTDTALAFMQQILFHPRFDEAKIDNEKKIRIEGIRHRFDNPSPTLSAAYEKLMYPASPASDLATIESIGRITRADMVALHRTVFTTGNIIFSIAGKFNRSAMIARLEALFPAAEKLADSTFPKIAIAPTVKCLVVHKPISQVYVRFGAPLFKRPNADYYPASVANLILGGGGFTSRLENKVRSDAGLTYSIYSNAESNYTFPGTWFVDFFTKSESFPQAMALALQVIAKQRATGVTDTELANAKASLIGEMPSMFRNRFDIVSTYAWNEYYGRSPNHYKEYPDSVRGVTRESITRVMKKYLDSSAFSFAVVGDTAALAKYTSAIGFAFDKLTPRKTIVPGAIPSLP